MADIKVQKLGSLNNMNVTQLTVPLVEKVINSQNEATSTPPLTAMTDQEWSPIRRFGCSYKAMFHQRHSQSPFAAILISTTSEGDWKFSKMAMLFAHPLARIQCHPLWVNLNLSMTEKCSDLNSVQKLLYEDEDWLWKRSSEMRGDGMLSWPKSWVPFPLAFVFSFDLMTKQTTCENEGWGTERDIVWVTCSFFLCLWHTYNVYGW